MEKQFLKDINKVQVQTDHFFKIVLKFYYLINKADKCVQKK